MMTLWVACSIDVGRLRAPPVAARDAAVDLDPLHGIDANGAPDIVPGFDLLAGRDDGSDLDGLPSTPDRSPTVEDTRDTGDGPGDEEDAPAGVTDDGGGAGGAGGGANGTGGAGGIGAGGFTGTGGTVGTGGDVGLGGAVEDPDLVLWYRFDESSGTVAADSSASGPGLDAAVKTAGAGGSASFSTDCQVGSHALRLTPSSSLATPAGGYVTTPAPASLAPGAITLAVWVKLASPASAQEWARVFDFGTGTGTTDPYFYMTIQASDSATLRFGITDVGHGVGGVQRIDAPSPLVANVWQHIAVVLPAGATYTGTLYIDGVAVAANKAMTVHPADVGVTTQNWLGRSPYAGDPFFSGWLDDFRIYKRALSAAEVAAVALR